MLHSMNWLPDTLFKDLTFVNECIVPKPFERCMLIFSFYTWGNWGTERFSNLSKVMVLESGSAEI